MSYNGHTVIDMDCHIREYVDLDRTYKGNMDPEYRDAYEQLALAVAKRHQRGGDQMLFTNAQALVGPTAARRPLGVYDTFGVDLGAETRTDDPPIANPPRSRAFGVDPAVNWDPGIRIRDMDEAGIDISVIFASRADGFCLLRNVHFEHALHRAYHRFMSDYCADSAGRLRWVANATMRDPRSSADELAYWAQRDENLAGMFISRACPDGRLLDNPDLYPLFERSQELDLPIFVHGGTMRPPLTPGATDLDNAGFIISAVYHGWGGMTAVSALIGGGVLDVFPRLRIGVFESGAGWMPWLVEMLDESYRPGSPLTPKLKRKPSEVIVEGRLFHAVDAGERYLELCIDELGEDIWLFSTDYPHPGTPWPEGVQLITRLNRLSETAKVKLLGGNALRFLPRLA